MQGQVMNIEKMPKSCKEQSVVREEQNVVSFVWCLLIRYLMWGRPKINCHNLPIYSDSKDSASPLACMNAGGSVYCLLHHYRKSLHGNYSLSLKSAILSVRTSAL